MRRLAPLTVLAGLLASGCAAGQVSETAEQKASIDGVNASVRTIDLRAVAVAPPPTGLAAYPADTDAALNLVIVNNSSSVDTLTGVRTGAARSWANYADYNNAFQVQEDSLGKATGSDTSTPSSSAAAPSEPSDSAGSDGQSGSTDGAAGSGQNSTGGRPIAPRSSSASPTPEPLPTGTRSVVISPGGRIAFGTPEAKGAILLLGLRSRLFPGSSVRITFTFAQAGSVSVDVPVQLGSSPRGPEVGGGEDEGGE